MTQPPLRPWRSLSASLLLASSCFAPPLTAQVTTQGFLNLPRSEAPGTLLSHPNDNDSRWAGRMTTVQYVNGWVVTGSEIPGSESGSDLEMRVYDISNPAALVRRFPSDFGHSAAGDSWYSGNFGWNAHGSAHVGNYLAPRTVHVESYGGMVRTGATGGVQNVQGAFPFGPAGRGAHAGPWGASFPWYGSVGTFENFSIFKRIPNPTGGGFINKTLATFDHESDHGVKGWHPIFFGDLLIYVGDGGGSSGSSVVVYRLAYENFDNPDLMSVTPQLLGAFTGSFTNYWPNLFSDGDGLYVVGSQTDIVQSVEITGVVDPTGSGEFGGARSWTIPKLMNATYPVYQDQFAFIDHVKLDMTKFIAGDPNPEVLVLDKFASGNQVNTSQMSLPLGNLWLTGGTANSMGGGLVQGLGVWVQQQAPDTTAPKVAYHIPQAARTQYPIHAPLSFLVHETQRRPFLAGRDLLVRKVLAGDTLSDSVPGFVVHDMSGMMTFNPSQPLDENATYQVDFLSDPVADIGFVDTAGNYIEPYSFRFSTGSAIAGNTPATITSVNANPFKPTPGQPVAVTVNATDADAGDQAALQYRFNFDGTWGGWGGSPTASHTFNDSGRARVLVQVRDSAQNISSGSVNLLVTIPPASPAPTQSSTMAVGTLNNVQRLWVVNPDADTVSILNATTGAKLDEQAVGRNPRSVARDANGRFWVACHGSDEIWVLNANGQPYEVLETGYGSAPFAVCASPDGASIFATLYGSQRVLRFHIADPGNPIHVDTLPTPRAIAVSGNGQRVFVSRFISSDQQATVQEFESASAFTFKRNIHLAAVGTGDGGDRGAGVQNYLSGLTVSPGGNHLVVTAKLDNTQRGTLFGVGDLTHENTVRAILEVIDLGTNTHLVSSRRDFDNSDSPSSVAFTPYGETVLVTLQGNNKVVGIDGLTLGQSVGFSVVTDVAREVGLAPQGVLVDPSVDRIYVSNFMGRNVTVMDGSPLLNQNKTNLPVLATTSTVASEALAPDVLLGKQIFYNAADERMSAESYISCATCHLDGGHDGRVWDFTGRGEGLRRTTDLRGRGGMSHGNVHWSGNFDEIQDFEHDIRGPFGGAGFLALTPSEFAAQHATPDSNKAGLSGELDALAAYVSSLGAASVPRSPNRAFDGTMTAEAMAGALVAQQLNCFDCHSGSSLTESIVSPISSAGLRNVGTVAEYSGQRLGQGTLGGVDTPTLWGLHDSRVFLHHGQVGSLEEAMAFAGGQMLTMAAATFSGAGTSFTNNGPGGGGNHRGMFANTSRRLTASGSKVTWSNVDGGPGGAARIAMRYSATFNGTGVIRVNGVATPVSVNQSPNAGSGHRAWDWVAVETSLHAGTNNVVEYEWVSGQNVAINVAIIADSSAIAAAQPHRQVLTLTSEDRSNLLAWLEQLDGREPDGTLAPETTGQPLLVDGDFAASGNFLNFSGSSRPVHAGQGWGLGASRRWERDQANQRAHIINPTGSQSLTQVIDGAGITGGLSLQVRARNLEGDSSPNLLRVQLFGINGNEWTLSNWGAGLPSGATSYALLYDSGNLGGSTFAWKEAVATSADAGAGYDYLAVRIIGEGVTPANGDLLMVDDVLLLGGSGAPAGSAPVITSQPAGQTLYLGQTAEFTVGVSGDPTPTIEWFKGAASVGTGSTLTLTSVTGASAGSYHAVATNSLGSVSSASASLSVITDNGLPGLTLAPIGGATTAVSRVLAGGEWEQASNAAGLNGTSDEAMLSYQTFAGDFEAVVQVKALSGPASARAGLMLREGAGSNVRTVAIASRTDGFYVHQARASIGGTISGETIASHGGSNINHAFPNKWVLLQRVGDTVTVAVSQDDQTYLEIMSYTLTDLADEVRIGIWTSRGASGDLAVSQFDHYSLLPISAGGQENIVVNGDMSQDLVGNTGTTTDTAHADLGWTQPGSARWTRDSTNDWLVADDHGAQSTVQIITDQAQSTGLQTVVFDAKNTEGTGTANTLWMRVWGVSGAVSVSNWNNAGPSGGVLLYDSGNVGGSTFDWSTFTSEVDFGAGYEKIVVKIFTLDVVSGEGDFQAVDNVKIGTGF